MIKYKLGFTITPEVLFGILAKVLPIEDLHIEQLVERPMPDPAIRFDKQFDLPKPKPRKHRRNPTPRPRLSHGPNLKAGINHIIVKHLSDGGVHKTLEFRPLLKAAGYSESSVSSRMEELQKHGIIQKIGMGAWQLIERQKETA